MGRAQLRAAHAYGVPHAAFGVHGSDRTNAVALSRVQAQLWAPACARRARGAPLDHQRNDRDRGHAALRSQRIGPSLRGRAAPSPSQIDEALTTGSEIDVVVVTSPVYEGFHARIPEIADVVHRNGALLHVDAAWGPLEGFHPGAAAEPVACGATPLTSIHKLGGALSQAALLTWSDDRLDPRAIRAAQLSTAQPHRATSWPGPWTRNHRPRRPAAAAPSTAR